MASPKNKYIYSILPIIYLIRINLMRNGLRVEKATAENAPKLTDAFWGCSTPAAGGS
jgi:hypothetical protein